MTSSEYWRGREAANFYGPERVQWNRAARTQYCRDQIVRIDNESEARRLARRAEHIAGCSKCQQNAFCLDRFKSSDCDELVPFINSVIFLEEQDELYAREARRKGVDYREHIDGFCSYWQNLRHRKFKAVEWKCERCGESGALEAHHRHYDTVGYEEIADIEALCARCHRGAHRYRF